MTHNESHPGNWRIAGRMIACTLLFSAALLSGCKDTYYDLELRPEGDSLHRKLSLPTGPMNSETDGYVEYQQELLRIAGLYEMDRPTATTRNFSFEGTFRSRTPDDLGGSGYFLYCDSPLGSTSAYSEQIRGQDDLAVDLEQSHAALNRIIDVWILWLQSEFGDAEEFPDLRRVIDKDVRRDLWNLTLYLWTFSVIGSTLEPPFATDFDNHVEGLFLMRVAHYLAARDYFDPLQIPQFEQAIDVGDSEDIWRPLLTIIARALANKMGISSKDPLPRSLAAMRDESKKYTDSAERFFDESEEMRRVVAAWNSETGLTTPYVFKDAEYLDQLSNQAFRWEVVTFGLGGPEILRVELHLPREPYFNNGEWSGEGVLKWQEGLAARAGEGSELPNTLYAFWSEPETALQEKHFGRVVLDDEELSYYCIWHQSLNKKQTREWDRFVSTLKPSPQLIQTLRNFAFKTEHKDRRPSASTSIRSDIADDVIRGIITVLQPDKDKTGEKLTN